MGTPEPPKDEAPVVEEEAKEGADTSKDTKTGGSGGEKPDGHYSG